MMTNDYFTKHFDLACNICKSREVLMSISENEIVTRCLNCRNMFVIKLEVVPNKSIFEVKD